MLFKPKKYNFHTADTHFDFDENLLNFLGSGGFEFCDGYSVLHIANPDMLENINFYTHEFSEITTVGVIRKCTKRWRSMPTYKGFTYADVAHLITPYAYPNKCCIFPDQTFKKAFKSLWYRLKPIEREMRILL